MMWLNYLQGIIFSYNKCPDGDYSLNFLLLHIYMKKQEFYVTNYYTDKPEGILKILCFL